MGKTNKNKLLKILVRTRTINALDIAINKNKVYQNALKQQTKAFHKLEKASLSKKQYTIVDNIISATNDCGTIYGEVAYQLGLYDGIRLISELKKVK